MSNSCRIPDGCSPKWYGIGGGVGGGDGGTDFIGEVGRLMGDASVIREGMLLYPASSIESVTFRGIRLPEVSES